MNSIWTFRSVNMKTPLITPFRTNILYPEVLHHIHVVGPVCPPGVESTPCHNFHH